MEPVKIFNNVIIGQFVLTGVPVKVYVYGRYLTITDTDDVEDPTFGFGMDEDGDMQQYDYREIDHLLVAGNRVDLDTYNTGMGAKEDETDKEEPAEEEPKEESSFKLGDILNEIEEIPEPDGGDSTIKVNAFEVSQDEVDAELDAAKAEIDAAKAKAKAAKAAEKDTIKKAKEKMKAAKSQVIDEYHASRYIEPNKYTFGVGDIVKNKNKSCPHAGSMGVVKKLMDLPNDMGTVVMYTVTNNGPTFKSGDVLTKTMDQLEPIQSPFDGGLDEKDVRKVHGDEKIENPKTGKKIKFSSALKAPKGTAVYNKARKRYKQLKDK